MTASCQIYITDYIYVIELMDCPETVLVKEFMTFAIFSGVLSMIARPEHS